MSLEERMQLRELMAKEHNVKLGHHYSEPETAVLLGRNVSSLKRAREAGVLKRGKHFISLGPRGIRYVGYQIVDMLAFGIEGEEWDAEEARAQS
jgi:hypothetical protein